MGRLAIAVGFCVCCAMLFGIVLGDPAPSSGPPRLRRMEKIDLPDPEVSIEVRVGYRYVRSNGIPDHEPGDFPRRGNPNAIRPQQHTYRMPVDPKVNDRPTPMRGAFGVALNGVPFDPGTAEWWTPRGRAHDPSYGWNYDALSGKIDLGVDTHHAHVQPTGNYHYHGLPTGVIEQRRGDGMTLIGYAADGFPMYAESGYVTTPDDGTRLVKLRPSYRLKTGRRPGGTEGPGGVHDGTFVQDWEYVAGAGDLDECNGRFGVTPEYPEGTYYYVATDSFPYIARLYRGTPDSSFRHRGPPPGGRGGPGPERRPR